MNLSLMMMLGIFSFEIYRPLNYLVVTSADVRVMEACMDRYEKAVNEPVIWDSEKEMKVLSSEIEFKNVSFSYESNPVIKNMSFVAGEESMTALVGLSGCGKTTVTNLIARFWDVDEGQIEIGGLNNKEMCYKQLMSKISMVFQQVYLFQNTVFNNIAFGNVNATKEQVIDAARKARCDEFVEAMPEGFETVIGEGGATLSGDEKQRISIARAILEDAPTIKEEAHAISDAMKLRGLNFGLGSLIKKTLKTIEYLYVPLLYSMVKSGNELTVAALTRGLVSGKKRTYDHEVNFGVQDLVALFIFIVLMYSSFVFGRCRRNDTFFRCQLLVSRK